MIGARIDGIEDTKIIDLVIKDLDNESPLVSNACGTYVGPHDGGSPGSEMEEGGMGTDVRGIAISRGDVEIIGDKSKVSRMQSFYGDTTGIDIFNDATVDFDVGGDIEIKNLRSASRLTQSEYNALVAAGKTPFPNNFDLCTINIEDTSTVTGDVPEGKEESDCIEGTWKNKVKTGLVSAGYVDLLNIENDGEAMNLWDRLKDSKSMTTMILMISVLSSIITVFSIYGMCYLLGVCIRSREKYKAVVIIDDSDHSDIE